MVGGRVWKSPSTSCFLQVEFSLILIDDCTGIDDVVGGGNNIYRFYGIWTGHVGIEKGGKHVHGHPCSEVCNYGAVQDTRCDVGRVFEKGHLVIRVVFPLCPGFLQTVFLPSLLNKLVDLGRRR